ncbi:inward rectifier potassium channel 16-like isoform X2 [Nerophis lumbriciformis]|uniref:inward rectifier potassium channel 16-like isoform X2 n=1 Tax=Nerophis lumbriciformis TaxID=546530 RepID=UPI002AE035C4|nr:inward rectifier potassium channel 16-like isoform X2 [Nerophis lumbriciformis]
MMPPSLATRVNTMDASMLTTSIIRHTQKWYSAAEPTRQLVVEDDEEHGEAERQGDFEGVALAASQWQGKANHVGQNQQNARKEEGNEGVLFSDSQHHLEHGGVHPMCERRPNLCQGASMSSDRPDEVSVDTFSTTVHTVGVDHGGGRLRFMHKDGRFPVVFQKVPRDWSPYLTDIFTTLVEIRWRVMLLVFSLSYIVSWLFFGLCYWLIAWIHGDDQAAGDPCVVNVYDFTSAFLFSMETQATIGYGSRGMTETCVGAVVVVTAQDVFSCLLDTAVIGIVIAKMASARKRALTVGFSRLAVVNMRDGVLCLSWRIGDFRGNHILEGVARAQLVRYSKQSQGPVVISYQDLDIHNRDLVLATPATVLHKLHPGSPLYTLTPDDLSGEDFELVVSFTYTGDSTGMLHQTRTSYTPADIHWGQRFQDMLKVGSKHYKVDYALFNETTWVTTPLLSAAQYDRGRSQPGLSPAKLVKRERRCTEEVMQQTHL